MYYCSVLLLLLLLHATISCNDFMQRENDADTCFLFLRYLITCHMMPTHFSIQGQERTVRPSYMIEPEHYMLQRRTSYTRARGKYSSATSVRVTRLTIASYMLQRRTSHKRARAKYSSATPHVRRFRATCFSHDY